MDLEWDFEAAARSERVKDTLDYDHIADLLTELAQERQYQLIETFAWEATEALLARYPACGGVAIEIRKPAAVPAAEAARVRLHRSREDA